MDLSYTMIKSINVTEKNFLDYYDFALKRLPKVNPIKAKPRVNQAKSYLKSVIVWTVLAVIIMTIFKSESVNFSSFHWQSSLVTAAPFILIIFAILFYMNKYRLLSIPKENGLMLGSKTIEFQSDGINETNSFSHCFYKWEIVEALEENKGDIYIFLDKLFALIIPSESFSTEAEKEELKVLVRKYIKQVA